MANNIRLNMLGISKQFGATQALSQVDFDVKAGEVHAIVGENGAGKSTLMKILAGLYAPGSGIMELNGKPYLPKDPLCSRQAGICMVYQELSLADHLSVAENILLGIEPNRLGVLNRNKIKNQVTNILSKLAHPEIKPNTKVKDLSISAQQLVEIGRALAIDCQVLILDEPTSSLTQADSQRLFELIHELKSQNIAIIYISHFLEEVNEIADRVTVLRDGVHITTRQAGALSEKELIEAMVGQAIQELYPHSTRIPGNPLLEIKDLAGSPYPHSSSLTLYRGEVFGIFGLVGAGRSELLRTLFGLDPIRSGEIRMQAINFTPQHQPSPRQWWRQGLGFLSEDRQGEALAPHLSLAENLCLSHLEDYGRFGLSYPKHQQQAMKRWIQKLDIRCQGPKQNITALSGGNQQKVALARLLEKDVDILLLDEPTRGVDVAAKAKIYEIIDQITRDNPKTAKAVLVVSSYLPELLGICDRVAVMHHGKLGPALPIDQVSEHSLMTAAFQGDPIS